jgi:uncharacterized protein with GYD domain
MVCLTHTPENCLARAEYKEEGKKWIANMRKTAQALGVKIESAYVTPNEHTFYLVLESDDFKKVSEFLGPPMLQLHSGKISPVMTFEEAFGLSFMENE